MSDRETTATRLLRSSAEHSYDPGVEIDWDAPLGPDRWFVPPHRSSLYGTVLWDRLTGAEHTTLPRPEGPSLASLGVCFETTLMQLLPRDSPRRAPTAAPAQSALIE